MVITFVTGVLLRFLYRFLIFQQLNLSPMAITRSPHLWPPSHPGRRDLLWTDCWTCWRGQSQTPPMKTIEGMCATQPLPPIKTTLPYIIQCYTITRLQTVASGTHTTELGPSVCLCYFMNPPAPLQCITTTSLPL